jgi:hypothetical protein
MSQVEAPKYLKNGGFGDHFHHAGWPKVADIVIEADSYSRDFQKVKSHLLGVFRDCNLERKSLINKELIVLSRGHFEARNTVFSNV